MKLYRKNEKITELRLRFHNPARFCYVHAEKNRINFHHQSKPEKSIENWNNFTPE